jgi:UDP-glucose:(heptosyl)LPS alpha-1,3-glucosyltransferase
MRWIRIPGPNRPFPLAFCWFWAAASVVTALRRRGLVHSTGSLIGNRVDLSTVHFCHLAVRRRGRLVRRRRINLAYTLNAFLSPLISEVTEAWSYRRGRVQRLVAVSDGVLRELRQCFPELRKLIETIPNGVDLDLFRPDAARRTETRFELGLDARALVAVFVGGEWEAKGLAHAIEAVARRPGWRLIVVGAGDAAGYARRAAAAGCADRVHFVGQVSDPARWYAAADAFVLPSRYETFSLVTYEAAACGLPLLATRVSGVEDVLCDGRNGWFIEPDGASVAAKLALLERDAGLRARLGREARVAAGRFDWPSVVSAYLDLYARLAANGDAAVTRRRPRRAAAAR